MPGLPKGSDNSSLKWRVHKLKIVMFPESAVTRRKSWDWPGKQIVETQKTWQNAWRPNRFVTRPPSPESCSSKATYVPKFATISSQFSGHELVKIPVVALITWPGG
jgi:hypothetical protein